MIQILVYYDPTDLKKCGWTLDRFVQNAKLWVYHEAPRMMALGFRNVLMADISGGAPWFSGAFMPYNPRYAAWKADYGGHGGFWMLSGDLLASIRAWSLGYNPNLTWVGRSGAYLGGAAGKAWAVGIKRSAMDSGGKSWLTTSQSMTRLGRRKHIGMYATVLEWGGDYRAAGGGLHHARPMFKISLLGFHRKDAPRIGRTILDRIVIPWKWRGGGYHP
jgi:hypothetical protein